MLVCFMLQLMSNQKLNRHIRGVGQPCWGIHLQVWIWMLELTNIVSMSNKLSLQKMLQKSEKKELIPKKFFKFGQLENSLDLLHNVEQFHHYK